MQMKPQGVYESWEIRTPYSRETFKSAIERIKREAAEMGIFVRWRKGTGQSTYGQPTFHYWEVKDETEALQFMLAFGDEIKKKFYPIEENVMTYKLQPTFKNHNEYKTWRADWNVNYKELSQAIRKERRYLKASYGWKSHVLTVDSQRRLLALQTQSRQMNELLLQAKERMASITKMKRDLQDHKAEFPIELGECRNVDFHFNKKHIEFDFVPMWVVKAKGKTYYVDHVNAQAPWSTRETPDNPATKGAIRFKSCQVSISADGIATLQ